LAAGKVTIRGGMSSAEEERERSLEQTLTSLYAQVQHEKSDAAPDPARLADLQTKAEKSRLEYASFQTDLYLRHPHLRTKRGLAPLISAAEAADLLPDAGTTLLEFVVGEKTTYLLTLVRGARDAPDLRIFEIPASKKDLTGRVEHFREQLAHRDLDFSHSAKELYDLLLKPADLQFKSAKTLVIVPDGPLWALPFQALQNAQNDYLLLNYVVAYVPSLSVLREMVRPRLDRNDANATPTTLLAMGNPTFGEKTAARLEMAYRGERLGPIPSAGKEVEMLGQLYGSQSKIYVGDEAREDRFKTEAGNFKVLHLATHGLFNDASPMYSYVLLSPGEGGKEDGLLEAWEIMNLDLKADVAVLSACETARGRIGGGEGIIGLTWAFFVAGVPTTVASQWKVESNSTTELMLAFHRALRVTKAQKNSSFATAKALRMAELELLHKGAHTHPFYWAGFVVTGNPN
jgi:CHAT domain-containing protein